MRPDVTAEISATRDAMATLRRAVEAAFPAKPALAELPDGLTPAARLRAFRLAGGLTIRAFSAELGVSKGYVGDIENGRCEPSRNFARKLAERYGVSADWLLFGRGAA